MWDVDDMIVSAEDIEYYKKHIIDTKKKIGIKALLKLMILLFKNRKRIFCIEIIYKGSEGNEKKYEYRR